MVSRDFFCPICKTRLQPESVAEHQTYLPFCSARCQKLDLGSWAREEYRVPTNERVIIEQPDSEEN